MAAGPGPGWLWAWCLPRPRGTRSRREVSTRGPTEAGVGAGSRRLPRADDSAPTPPTVAPPLRSGKGRGRQAEARTSWAGHAAGPGGTPGTPHCSRQQLPPSPRPPSTGQPRRSLEHMGLDRPRPPDFHRLPRISHHAHSRHRLPGFWGTLTFVSTLRPPQSPLHPPHSHSPGPHMSRDHPHLLALQRTTGRPQTTESPGTCVHSSGHRSVTLRPPARPRGHPSSDRRLLTVHCWGEG